ncbi:hypothetical protein [Tenacibaculum piscium]|uniref:hypothetical protein n=1 Tax=Tenacibaculum piscium TaxID=1458515 RepID=UPI001F170245|nr:hypothetical protein [Tenacibaculum piscium]
MKKMLFLFVSIPLILFTSCSDDEDDTNTVNSYAKITVKQEGKVKSGITVCMFKKEESSFFTPFYADKKVITESNGTATFNLQEVYDLNIIDSQTTLYFGVFDDKTILGKTALTIEKGQTKTAEINY